MVVYAVIHDTTETSCESNTIVAICESMESAKTIIDKVFPGIRDNLRIKKVDTEDYEKFISGEYRVFWAEYKEETKHLTLYESYLDCMDVNSIGSDSNGKNYTMEFFAKDFGDAEKKFMEKLAEYKKENNFE